MFVKTLNNELRFCIENIESDFVTISYYINAGSFDEPIDKLGIAHLTEHLVFKGTMNRKAEDIFTEIERLGGTMNAYTTETHTVFYVTILKEYWKQAVDVLSDIVWCNTIPEEEFERERNVVLEELKMYNDDGKRHVLDVMTKTAFKETKNKWNNGGTVQSVSKISKQDVEDFIDNFYVPSNTSIYVVGDINNDEFIEFVDNYISNYEFNTNIKQFRDDSKKVIINDEEESIDTTQSHMVMYFPFKSNSNLKEFLISDLAQDIFGNGFGSRLMELREKYGYAYTIYCNSFESQPESLIYVYIGLNKDNVSNAKDLILKKIDEIKNNGITSDEFSAAYNCTKTALKKKALFTESITDMRIMLKGMGIDSDEIEFDDIIKELDSVSIQDLNNFYKEVFNPDNVGCITLIQTKTGNDEIDEQLPST